MIGNHYRCLTVLKSSHGEESVSVNIWIDNAHLLVERLHHPERESRLLVKQLESKGVLDSSYLKGEVSFNSLPE